MLPLPSKDTPAALSTLPGSSCTSVRGYRGSGPRYVEGTDDVPFSSGAVPPPRKRPFTYLWSPTGAPRVYALDPISVPAAAPSGGRPMDLGARVHAGKRCQPWRPRTGPPGSRVRWYIPWVRAITPECRSSYVALATPHVSRSHRMVQRMQSSRAWATLIAGPAQGSETGILGSPSMRRRPRACMSLPSAR